MYTNEQFLFFLTSFLQLSTAGKAFGKAKNCNNNWLKHMVSPQHMYKGSGDPR